MTEIEIKYTNRSIDDIVVNLAEYVDKGFHIASGCMEHSYNGDTINTFELIKLK